MLITKSVTTLKIFPFILVYYEIVNYLANDMYLPALPNLEGDFNVHSNLVQLTLTTWFLGTSSLQLILGPLSDQIGRKPVLLWGGLIFSLATAICAYTTDINLFLIARFFQGCAVCTIGTAGYSSIHESYNQNDAIRLIAIMGSITVLAPALGPFIGSLILQFLSWRWIFAILTIAGSISVIMFWLFMPETYTKLNDKTYYWKSLFLDYRSIILNTKFISNTFIFCFILLGMIAWITVGPFLIINEFHFSPLIFGILQFLIFGNLIFGAFIVNYLINRMHITTLIKSGIIITFIGSLLACITSFYISNSIYGLILGLSLYSLGSSLIFSPSQRLAITACSEPMGERSAVFSSLLSLFGALGSLIANLTIFESTSGFSLLLILTTLEAGISYWGSVNTSN